MQYIVFLILFVLIFLLGITWLRKGLFHVAGNMMEKWLKKITSTPLKGMVAGIIMTAILQSSAAVMVITIGLVGARILTFSNTIGIILGTNIGTTLTLEFLSFNLTFLIIPLFIISLILLPMKHKTARNVGLVFSGFGLVLGSMRAIEWIATPLTHIGVVQNITNLMDNNMYLAFVIGAILTAFIQSSTVMTGIAMSFLTTNVFPLETGISIMIGANIGTCITSLLASLGAGEEARLTAFSHAWLNIFGAILFLPLTPALANLCRTMTSDVAIQLAHASVIFNVICSIIVLPFSNRFGYLIEKMHGKKV